ncbi:hypothetical protein LTR53_008940, partial [Teratosphaeriaceae sp. CCFEE 6253]
ELIDSHLANAGNIVNRQAQQAREIASQQTSKAMNASSSTFNQYSAKAKDMMGQAKGKAVEQNVVSPETANQTEETLRSAPSAPAQAPRAFDNMQAQMGTAEPYYAQ